MWADGPSLTAARLDAKTRHAWPAWQLSVNVQVLALGSLSMHVTAVVGWPSGPCP